MNIKTAQIQLTILTLAAALVVGCKGNDKPKMSINDSFEPEADRRDVQKIFARQQQIGAREDGVLYASHFTGTELNSLGRQKLELMTGGPSRGVVTVYLSVPKDNAYAGRETAITTYLQHKGLASEAYAVVAGPNTNNGIPAVQGLNGLAKQNAISGGGDATAAAPAK